MSPGPNTTISRYEVQCSICCADVRVGDAIFCFSSPDPDRDPSADQSGKKKPLHWAHEACWTAGLPPPPACRHWSRLGRCPVNEAGLCAFRHDESDRHREAEGAVATDEADTSSNAPRTSRRRRLGSKRSRRVIRNRHKTAAVRIFLMQTYGLDYLRKSNGAVLDVAGGKGELAWELLNLVGVADAAVVDPRPLSLEIAEDRWRKGLYEPKRTGPVFSKWQPSVREGSSVDQTPRRPRHIRCYFDAGKFARLVLGRGGWNGSDTGDGDDDGVSWFGAERERARAVQWTTKGLQNLDSQDNCDSHDLDDEENDDTSSHGETCTWGESNDDSNSCNGSKAAQSNDEVTDVCEVKDLLHRCHLVVGLHPDQAASEIMRYADAVGVPWACIPCCTYSSVFTKRRLNDGTHVRSYEQLVQWVCEQSPRAQVAELGFEGKNKVVYTLPSSSFSELSSK